MAAAAAASTGAPAPEGSPAIAAGGVEEALWQMNLGGSESMESGPYPERSGEADCSYYMRTGLCRFGATCKYNHPPNRKLAVVTAIMKGEYPQRIGQPECQYYLKTGTCKFGATCKFHHPREKAGIASCVQFNILGYPLRPNEKECAYYTRTGLCKFGNTCKFNHPQPSNAMIAVHGSYPSGQSAASPAQQSYPGSLASWSLSRGTYIANPRWQGPSSYAQLILPSSLVQVPRWNPYSAQLGLSDEQQRTPGTGQYYTHRSEASETSDQVGFAAQRENNFPVRPDQPECQFYMKTGDCKFGAACRYHHPKERLVPTPNCSLSPLNLPLRPGEPVCSFYSRYGICKYGPNCKFDHPVGTYMYGYAASATAEVPASRPLTESSSLHPEEPCDDSSERTKKPSVADSHEMPSSDGSNEREAP